MMPRPKAVHVANHDMPDPASLFEFVRPEWHARAACRGTMQNGKSKWFPEPNQATVARQAFAVCDECPVRYECAEAGRNEFGIWGGNTRRQRGRVRTEEMRRILAIRDAMSDMPC